MVIRLWLDNSDSNPGRGSIHICAPERPDQLWGPPSLLFNGYRGSLGVNWPGPDSHLLSRLRTSRAVPLLPLHAFMTVTETHLLLPFYTNRTCL